MSMNDDPASRRGRRPEQGNQQWHSQERDAGQDRWPSNERGNDPYSGPNGRDDPRYGNEAGGDARKPSFSNFSGHNTYAKPASQDQAPPPPPSPTMSPRIREQAQQQPAPAPQPYYPEPVPQREPVREYHDATYDNRAPAPSYGGDYQPAPTYMHQERDDLFGRDHQPAPYNPAFADNSRGDIFERADGRQGAQPLPRQFTTADDHSAFFGRETTPQLDDYERNSFSARIAPQDNQSSSRFYLPEEPAMQPQQHYAPDRNFGVDRYDSVNTHRPSYAETYEQEPRDWHQEQSNGVRGHEMRSGVPSRVPQHNELDEDFFADEDDLDHDDYPPAKKGRKKLVIAAIVGAVAVGGGGAYFYKSTISGSNTATPVVRADNKPAKEPASNPGGKQFANGEKAIYDRLTPQGAQNASFGSPPQPFASPNSRPSGAPASTGNSLEDRIEEALRKSQTAGGGSALPSSPTGDQPTVVASERYGPDGRRIDSGPRPAASGPSFTTANPLSPSFGSTPQPSSAPQPPFRTASAAPATVQASPLPKAAAPAPVTASAPPPAPAPQQTRNASPSLASTTPASAGGFYVQIKSSQDEKAATRELPTLTEKYGTVLGDVQLSTKTVDLGDKGVWFRVVAGPLPSKDAAMALCNKMKAASLACVVPRD